MGKDKDKDIPPYHIKEDKEDTEDTLQITMCPILSRCLSQDSDSDLVHLGCSSSRCWAEINDKFGEPLGSYRKLDRFGHHRCFAGSFTLTRFSSPDSGEEDSSVTFSSQELVMERSDDPGTVLDISVKKQQERSEDLYRRVLVNNTAKAAQREVS